MDVSVNIYVHKRGNLVEHLANNWAVKNLIDSKFRQFYSFNVVQFRKLLRQKKKIDNSSSQSFDQVAVYNIRDVIILRHRNKRNSKCNPMEMNSDELWRAEIMASFGCTPAYWGTFKINSATSSKLRTCTVSNGIFYFCIKRGR